jgi:hypothetical protein
VFENPAGEAQERYNQAHIRTRRIVENAIGLWKSVFRRIHESGGVLLYEPETACQIITATAVLHNMRRELKLDEDNDIINNLLRDNTPSVCAQNLEDNIITHEGRRVREEIVTNYFT